MHRQISDKLEDYLKSGSNMSAEFQRHLEECADCAGELRGLEAQSQLLRSLAAAKVAEPRAGFYARVLERIEAQQPFSIWSVFLQPKFGFRLAVASGMLAALLGAYLVTSEPGGPETSVASGTAISSSASNTITDASLDRDGVQRDAVLVDLASYRQ
jgi:anti-sigma factor RsiW